ncbi:CAP domain-containing protein [Streptosporangium sp. NBC_01756]|uniref:CAP domain-containing protein n=1 Tax=Streptosporangium sp. NBC_01756 TaxID=2975950 RepID=UPI002DD82F2D|nr:CAP domain-containing protein [Streptosporangium sp. NBC_01756]WSC88835.1 CAP domain-containing protein [Streptosporangium sp. NBC_01756]
MRRPLGVLACLGSLAALSTPIATAQAATAPQSVCGVYAAAPHVTSTGKIQASAARLGCKDTALVRVRIKRAVAGPDPIVRSASKRGSNGRVTVALRCTPGVYYTVVTDYRGHSGTSKAARLSCSPTGTPSPAPTATAKPTATPTAKPTAAPTTPPPAGTVGTADENEVLRLVNAERAKGGCQPLKHDAQLRKAAYDHSADMAAQNYFSHTSKDGRSFMDRIRAAGFTGGSGWAENIAAGQATPAAVTNSWMNSPGHKANIMNCKFTLIGVGVAKGSQGYKIYWTQDFAAR